MDEQCPLELRIAIIRYFPEAEWMNAQNIARLESGWNAFALRDTTDRAPCGEVLEVRDGVRITSERSVGYFQINSCNYPDWEWQRLYNADHNAGTAHMIWAVQGWGAWFYSAKQLALL